jgi:hypothetical protein
LLRSDCLATICPFANHHSPLAIRHSPLATVSLLSQRFRQPLNGFCDFAPFGIQFLWVTLVIGLAADETVKGR